MYERLEDEVDTCDDFSSFFEEESMPESTVHADLVWYLVAVLRWLFRRELCTICENLAFLPPLEQPWPPVAPDLAIIKGVVLGPLSCWGGVTRGPAPLLFLVFLSPDTCINDLVLTPVLFPRLGVN